MLTLISLLFVAREMKWFAALRSRQFGRLYPDPESPLLSPFFSRDWVRIKDVPPFSSSLPHFIALATQGNGTRMAPNLQNRGTANSLSSPNESSWFFLSFFFLERRLGRLAAGTFTPCCFLWTHDHTSRGSGPRPSIRSIESTLLPLLPLLPPPSKHVIKGRDNRTRFPGSPVGG